VTRVRRPGVAGTGVSGFGWAGTGAGEAPAAGRAARLLRWYPASWRARYGAEFAELLVSDIQERPRSAARTLDVARGGIVVRLTAAGLRGFQPSWAGGETGGASAADRHATAALVSLGCASAVFLGFGAAMWSQLTIGWQWSASGQWPDVASSGTAAPSTAAAAASGTAASVPAASVPAASVPAVVATVTTSATMIALLVLAAAAAIPVLTTLAVRLTKYRDKRLTMPALVLVVAVTGLFVGGRHFGNGWPGTGGHHGLVPGGLAAFEWALSLSVSSYWAHPNALAAFPAPELAWMAVSPVALAATVASAALCVRRVTLPPKLLRFEVRLAAVACAVMVVFLAACCCWVATSRHLDAQNPAVTGQIQYHAGLIDVVGMVALTAALTAGAQAASQAWRVLRITGCS